MPITRTEHNKNYSVINNTILSDNRLSFKAKGLWAYAMSRPDGWEFHITHLMTVSQDGKDAIYSALKELEDFGYFSKENIRGSKGEYLGVEYWFYETPQQLKKKVPQTENPDTENPERDFPDSGNPHLLSTDCHQVLKEQQHAVVFPDDPDKISENLMQGGLSKEKTVVALEIWKKYKEEIKKRSDNPTGYLIWMVKKEINPFKSLEVKKEKIQKRKEWAYKNERTACAGGSTATPEGYEVISGSIANFYRYDENSDFWNERQL